MNKYLLTKIIPYESEQTFTVFAETVEEAKNLILEKFDSCEINVDVLKYNIKGTKISRIHKIDITKDIL